MLLPRLLLGASLKPHRLVSMATVAGRVRSPTPPRITSHKPPRPEGPPPALRLGVAGGVLASGVSATAASSSSTPTLAGSDASRAPATPSEGATPVDAATPSSRTALPPPPAVHTGWLVKEGGARNILGRRSWKRRWFVLDRGSLQYFETEAAWSAGRLPIHDATIPVAGFRLVEAGAEAGEGADFALVPRDGAAGARTWRFRGETSADVTTWLRVLRTSCPAVAPA